MIVKLRTWILAGTASAAVVAAVTLAIVSVSSVTVVTPAQARDHVSIVGSSTVAPFSNRVAEEYKNKTGQNIVVESTGSGGGHQRFCQGQGEGTPDITNSSRRQKKSEFDDCIASGVDGVVEVKIGFDGIVMANALGAAEFDVSERQIFQAFAARVPTSEDDCTLIDNPYTRWNQIDPSLPDQEIEAYGPPPTSGTRDAFVELAMEAGARDFDCLRAVDRATPGRPGYEDALAGVPGLDEAWLLDKDGNPRDGGDIFTEISHRLREDNRWIDSGENDNAIVQTLIRTPSAVGVFGFSFLDQNRSRIKAAMINGVEPDFETIAAGDYPVSRSLYIYVKRAHAAGEVAGVPGEAIQGYLAEFTSEAAWGPGGYLEEEGLIPLPDELRERFRDAALNLETYSQ